MNFSRFEGGRSAQVPAPIDLAETMPFFAEHRVILVEDSGFSKMQRPSWRISAGYAGDHLHDF